MRRWRENLGSYGFITPAFVILSVFVLFPFLFVIYLSFHHWNLISPNPPWVGLTNYIDLMHSHTFWQSLLLTVYFIVGTVPAQIVLALVLALLLSGRIRGLAGFRLGVFSPYVTPVVATTIVWLWIFNPEYGLLNYALHIFHLPALPWLTSPTYAMPGVMIYSVWHDLGFSIIIYLAGITNLPRDIREAARIDGAGAWQEFWRITWPLLTPTTFFLVVINSIGAFKVFTQIYTLTGGGPVQSTTTTGFYLYQYAFTYFKIGYASTVAVALFIFILILTLVQLFLAERRVHYQ